MQKKIRSMKLYRKTGISLFLLFHPNSWSVAYHRKKIHGNIGHVNATGKVGKENYRIQCRDCEEVLPNKNALYKHRKETHSDCSSNGQGTGNRTTCERHQAVGRDNTCPDCCRIFKSAVPNVRLTAMRNHRLVHNGVRAWACARCPKRFRIRSELRTHLRLKHPVSMLVIEVSGLNPTHEDIMNILAVNDISREKVNEVTKISFPKGTTSIVPNSARALSMLSTVPRTQVACGRPAPERIVEDYRPARRGRGLCKTPGRFRLPAPTGVLPVEEQAVITPSRISEEGEGLPDLNAQLRSPDSPLVDGAKMVQLQFEDTMILE